MYILFTTSKKFNFLSNAVRWFIKDKNIKLKDVPSHVAIRFGEPEQNWMIQSHAAGVEPEWWNNFKKRNIIIGAFKIIGLSTEDSNELTEKLISSTIDKGYDYLAIVGFMWGQIKRKITGQEQKINKLGSNKRFFCVELAFRLLKLYEQKTGYSVLGDLNSESTHPLKLLKLLKTLPQFVQEVDTRSW
jgi:hypothetical protein